MIKIGMEILIKDDICKIEDDIIRFWLDDWKCKKNQNVCRERFGKNLFWVYGGCDLKKFQLVFFDFFLFVFLGLNGGSLFEVDKYIKV